MTGSRPAQDCDADGKIKMHNGTVQIELTSDKKFRVSWSTILQTPFETHDRYDAALKSAFAHARKYASVNLCKYDVVDKDGKITVIDGTALIASELDAMVASDVPHREYVVAKLIADFMGRSRIGFDAADISAAKNSHPAMSLARVIRGHNTLPVYYRVADALESDDWVSAMDVASQVVSYLRSEAAYHAGKTTSLTMDEIVGIERFQ